MSPPEMTDISRQPRAWVSLNEVNDTRHRTDCCRNTGLKRPPTGPAGSARSLLTLPGCKSPPCNDPPAANRSGLLFVPARIWWQFKKADYHQNALKRHWICRSWVGTAFTLHGGRGTSCAGIPSAWMTGPSGHPSRGTEPNYTCWKPQRAKMMDRAASPAVAVEV